MTGDQQRPVIGLKPLFDNSTTTVRMADGVYDRIVGAIRAGMLKPGDPFRDRDIADGFGISRTPVREAMQRLERAGLLDVWPGRQTRVRVIDPADTARLHSYFGDVCGVHVRLLLESDVLAPRERRDLDEAAAEVAAADEVAWGEAFTALMERVSKPDRTVWGRMLVDHLPLLSLVLRTPPEPDGDRAELSDALRRAIADGAGADAERAIRSLFGVRR